MDYGQYDRCAKKSTAACRPPVARAFRREGGGEGLVLRERRGLVFPEVEDPRPHHEPALRPGGVVRASTFSRAVVTSKQFRVLRSLKSRLNKKLYWLVLEDLVHGHIDDNINAAICHEIKSGLAYTWSAVQVEGIEVIDSPHIVRVGGGCIKLGCYEAELEVGWD